jgi:PQQ-like domain
MGCFERLRTVLILHRRGAERPPAAAALSRGTSLATVFHVAVRRHVPGVASRLGVAVACASLAACGGVPPSASGVSSKTGAATIDASGAMMAADGLRTGFYSNQPLLDPTIVGSPYFGQIFNATLDGAIYAQPLSANGVLFVATESNALYALDPSSGATIWSRLLAAPWNAADVNCGDLTPTVGVTGTPAIDVASGTAYLFSKTYAVGTSGPAAWFAHAIDLTTGAERAGFPVAIAGTASNEPAQIFDPTREMQRPGLLLMDGVVYAAFGAHCDSGLYTGWVIGVSTQGSLKTMWTTESGPTRTNGGGIWQSGGALVSDGDGQILLATANDWSAPTTPVPGHTPPGHLGESVVRLGVQANGTLAATDFFAPAELAALNQNDVDLGAGAPVALPASFGTTAHPNLLVQVGKSGYVYLLDRADLGGFMEGPGGGDSVLQRLGSYGGVWSKPSVWPGDGGYLYVPVVNGCPSATDSTGCLRAYKMGVAGDGTPALAEVATSNDAFGYGSSAVAVTANGTTSGSALLWSTWSSGWLGAASQLRAYDAVPTGGALTLRFLAGIGTSAKFTAPAIGDGRVYVGTRDGHVLGFGVTGAPPVRAEGVAFAPTAVGAEIDSDVQLTASTNVQIVALGVSGDFAVEAAAPAPPFALASGASVVIPVTFHPTTEGPIVGALQVTTNDGTFAIPLSGVGLSATPKLTAAPALLTFAPAAVATASVQTVTFTNVGADALTVTGLAPPASPFSVTGLPAVGDTLAPGDSFTATITFLPTAAGSSAGFLSVAAGETVAAVAVEGSALSGGLLTITPTALDLGALYVGDTATATFTLDNGGDSAVTIEKSKPPTTAAFQAATALDEGTVIAAGASLRQTIVVSPTAPGAASDVWQINANDGQGLRLVTMAVTGLATPDTAPAPLAYDPPSDPDPPTAAPPSTPATSAASRTIVGSCNVAGDARPPGASLWGLFAAAAAARCRTRRVRCRRRPGCPQPPWDRSRRRRPGRFFSLG